MWHASQLQALPCIGHAQQNVPFPAQPKLLVTSGTRSHHTKAAVLTAIQVQLQAVACHAVWSHLQPTGLLTPFKIWAPTSTHLCMGCRLVDVGTQLAQLAQALSGFGQGFPGSFKAGSFLEVPSCLLTGQGPCQRPQHPPGNGLVPCVPADVSVQRFAFGAAGALHVACRQAVLVIGCRAPQHALVACARWFADLPLGLCQGCVPCSSWMLLFARSFPAPAWLHCAAVSTVPWAQLATIWSSSCGLPWLTRCCQLRMFMAALLVVLARDTI